MKTSYQKSDAKPSCEDLGVDFKDLIIAALAIFQTCTLFQSTKNKQYFDGQQSRRLSKN